MKKLEKGVYDIPLVVSHSLESQIPFLKKTLIQAQKNIVQFATKHKWESLIETTFIKRTEIYDSHKEFIDAIMKFLSLPPSIKLPDSFSAVLEDDVLMLVSPDIYKKIYPIENDNPRAYERLMTHEIAHRLHVRIMNGNEDLMGPRWFYEGFACYVANQFTDFKCDQSEMLKIIKDDKTYEYKYYSTIFRKLLDYKSIEELIHLPKEETFIDWVKDVIS